MATRSVTARSDRPIRRWISWVRPDCFPLAASRPTRSADDPGSSEYSAVTQPLPLPRIHGGTRSSTDAVHSTLVLPIETSTDPWANSVKSRTKLTGRRSLDVRGRPAPRPGASGRSQRVPPAHGGLVDVARRRPRSPRPDGGGRDRGPPVGDHQPARRRPLGRRYRPACALMCCAVPSCSRCRSPRTARGRGRARAPRTTSPARSRQSTRGRPVGPSRRVARVTGGWSVRREGQTADHRRRAPSPSPTSCQSRIPSASWPSMLPHARRRRTPGRGRGATRRPSRAAVTKPSTSLQWSWCSWVSTMAVERQRVGEALEVGEGPRPGVQPHRRPRAPRPHQVAAGGPARPPGGSRRSRARSGSAPSARRRSGAARASVGHRGRLGHEPRTSPSSAPNSRPPTVAEPRPRPPTRTTAPAPARALPRPTATGGQDGPDLEGRLVGRATRAPRRGP